MSGTLQVGRCCHLCIGRQRYGGCRVKRGRVNSHRGFALTDIMIRHSYNRVRSLGYSCQRRGFDGDGPLQQWSQWDICGDRLVGRCRSRGGEVGCNQTLVLHQGSFGCSQQGSRLGLGDFLFVLGLLRAIAQIVGRVTLGQVPGTGMLCVMTPGRDGSPWRVDRCARE